MKYNDFQSNFLIYTGSMRTYVLDEMEEIINKNREKYSDSIIKENSELFRKDLEDILIVYENRLQYLDGNPNLNNYDKDLIKYGIKRSQFLVFLKTGIDRTELIPFDYSCIYKYIDKISIPRKNNTFLGSISRFFSSVGSYFNKKEETIKPELLNLTSEMLLSIDSDKENKLQPNQKKKRIKYLFI